MSTFTKLLSKPFVGLASKLSDKIFDTLDLKSIIKNSVLSALETVEQSFIDAAISTDGENDPATVEKMKKAAALALALSQLRQKGGIARIVALFATSAVKAAVNEVKLATDTSAQ